MWDCRQRVLSGLCLGCAAVWPYGHKTRGSHLSEIRLFREHESLKTLQSLCDRRGVEGTGDTVVLAATMSELPVSFILERLDKVPHH